MLFKNKRCHSFFAGLAVCVGILALSDHVASSQERPYFVDGFHGGVYGHYPMATYTRFLVDQFEANPAWRFCLEIEPETWDTVAVRTPEDYKRFSRIVNSPRVEFTNPTYAQPYMYNISGESIIRQMQYGMRKIHSHFPDVEFLTYSVEEPCFTSCLPQILVQLGFKYASTKCPNTCWGGYCAPFGHGLVNWIGPDGSSVIAVPRYECESLDEKTVWQTAASKNSDAYLEACRKAGIAHPVGMCFQDAGWTGGPWIGYGDETAGNSIYVTWREYFESVANSDPREDYKMSQEDVRTSLMWGSQVLQRIARQVRRTENNIVMTEKAGAMLKLDRGVGLDQARIDEAWRTLMLAQHHDSWIVPYNELNERGTWADNIAFWTSSADFNCEEALVEIVPVGEVKDNLFNVKVINTLSFSRNSVVSVAVPSSFLGKNLRVKDSKGKDVRFSLIGDRIVFRVGMRPFSMATFSVKVTSKRKESGTVVKEYSSEDGLVTVASDLYTITFDPSRGGTIVGLKTSCGDEYADAKSARAINELRGFFYDEGKWHSSADTPARISVKKTEGLTSEVEIDGSIAGMPFKQTIVLTDGDPLITCSLHIDWKSDVGIGKYRQSDAHDSRRRAFYDDRFKLNVLFPTSVVNPSLYKDAPFDVCKSAEEDTFYDSWDRIKHNIIHDWVDLLGEDGKGLALFSDHTTSYSFGKDFPLGLTVQFSGNGLWGRNYPVSGATEIRYAFMPHFGAWDSAGVYERNQEWNEPLMCFVTGDDSTKEHTFIDAEGTGYAVSAFYQTEGGFMLRLYNADGDDNVKTIRLGFPVSEIVETDLLGNAVSRVGLNEKSGSTGSFSVSAPRFSIRTYLLKTE